MKKRTKKPELALIEKISKIPYESKEYKEFKAIMREMEKTI